MKLNFRMISWFSLSLFILGVLLGLCLSSAVLWGELEARVRTSTTFPVSGILKLTCPLMLSPAESGKVRAVIVNSTPNEINPIVTAEISRADTPRDVTERLTLDAMEIRNKQWSVSGADVIFKRLILVNVYQSKYDDNISRLGTCGILFFSLFGLSGMESFAMLFVGSLIGIFLGGELWLYAYSRMNRTDPFRAAQAVRLLGVITVAALFSALPRWWGLTLIFDALILMHGAVLITEFGLYPKDRKLWA